MTTLRSIPADPVRSDLARLRDDAYKVLATLALVRTHGAGSTRRDPVKELTGHSALDRAVDETQDMLRQLDDMLGESEVPRREVAACLEPVIIAGREPRRTGARGAAPAPITPSEPSFA